MRLGQGNRQFRIFKFRSMRSDSSDADGSQSTARADGRITRIGHLIRRTSIDELPQLLNVIRGEMRSEDHTSELQSLMRTSYAVSCLKKKITNTTPLIHRTSA